MTNLQKQFKIAETLRNENGKRTIADRCGCSVQAVYQVLNPRYPDASDKIVTEIQNYIKSAFSDNNIQCIIGRKAA